MQTATFKATDNQEIAYCIWEPEAQAKGIITIFHGMAEHPERYDDFASFLTNLGYIVYAPAHRGHGATGHLMKRNGFPLGHFAEENGWFIVLNDLYTLNSMIRNKYPDLPLIVLGHSMGSMLLRSYMIKYPHIDAGIICGTVPPANFATKILYLICQFLIKVQGADEISTGLNKISLKKNSIRLKNMLTKFDWLSRDRQVVTDYIADPDCGFACSNSFFRDLTEGWLYFSNPQNLKNLCPEIPLLFISGSDDPIGAMGKGVKKSAELYKKYGCRDVTLKIFKDCRHEILNEVNKEDVYKFIADWLKSRQR